MRHLDNKESGTGSEHIALLSHLYSFAVFAYFNPSSCMNSIISSATQAIVETEIVVLIDVLECFVQAYDVIW